MSFKSTSLIALMALSILLTACGPQYKTVYSYATPETDQGRMCVIQCQKARTQCQHWQNRDRDSCLARAREQARIEYDTHVEKRRVSNIGVAVGPDHFLHKSHCDTAVGLNCAEDYRACFELCGGKVNTRQECIAFCD